MPADQTPSTVNRATHLSTRVFGMVLAISGVHHEAFEALQGDRETPGLIIQAMSPPFQRWHNGEEAFTVVPNSLVTGICAMIIGIVIIAWSLKGFQTKYGPVAFLSLFVLLTLCGGGIGYLIFFLSAWAYATRIRTPLAWWRKVLSGNVARRPARVHLPSLVLSALFLIIGLEISVFGIRGVGDDGTVLQTCWSFLLMSLVLLHVTYISGFAKDVKQAST